MWTDIYWIDGLIHGQLGTMPRPRGDDWLEDEIAHMKRRGVEFLVSALQDQEIFELGLTWEQRHASEAGIDMLHFPIPDRGHPENVRAFIETVQTLAAHLEQGKCIAVHCRQGIGRASLLAAGTLGAMKYSEDDAWQLITRARGRRVPDTDAQRAWLGKQWPHLSKADAYPGSW